jgi:hypothetical protein
MGDIERCARCRRLRQAYSAATLEHVRLDGELQRAARLGDTSSLADLASKCKAAEMRRSNALEATRAHVAEAHPAR